jgi:hypothetical protein
MLIEHDRIARLAYELWQRRGSPHGAAEEDWYRAEELLANDPGVALPSAAVAQPRDPVPGIESGRRAPRARGAARA